NRGARDIIPLWKNGDATIPNVCSGLLDVLSKHFREKITPENLFAYCYGLLGTPVFTEQFSDELADADLRIPLTKKLSAFRKAQALGERLSWLHTFGERYCSSTRRRKAIPAGRAKCLRAISSMSNSYPEKFLYDEEGEKLIIGDGRFAPVSKSVW